MVLAVLAMVDLYKVAEGVREHLDPLNRFVFKLHMSMSRKFLMNITGTYCTRHVELVKVAEGV